MFLGLIQQAATDTSLVTINKNSHLFLEIDPWGIGMTVIGYVVVFIALLFLYIIFSNLTKVLNINVKRLLRREGKLEISNEELEISGEVNAAIAMAIYLYYSEIHDKENTVLTIDKVSKTYSPWSSKIYGLRQHPRS
ncbi:MAG TPA: OadG family protein [Ignavibacteriaceae bacterium]|nr:OadG family protein [Ignavibacteriaceae bacterium]HRQ54295.1 OadG family protein [Ignavibacteriaceae bacterium]